MFIVTFLRVISLSSMMIRVWASRMEYVKRTRPPVTEQKVGSTVSMEANAPLLKGKSWLPFEVVPSGKMQIGCQSWR